MLSIHWEAMNSAALGINSFSLCIAFSLLKCVCLSVCFLLYSGDADFYILLNTSFVPLP